MTEERYEKLTLALSEDGFSVVNCEKDAVRVEIPASVRGVPVVEIAARAFDGCHLLKTVVFAAPEEESAGLQTIGDNAFMNCVALEELALPASVCNIGWGAFYCCKSLRAVSFPDGAYIASYAFSNCSSLQKIPRIPYASEGIFSSCEQLREVVLAPDVDEIGENAFEYCHALESFTVPASVTCIGAQAFRNCSALKRVYFEQPQGWFEGSVYEPEKEWPLDLQDPEKNAERLSHMDFDDGVSGWYRK